MKLNRLITITIFLIIVAGCKSGSTISNEQISQDLITKGVVNSEGENIDFASKYGSHCFKVDRSDFREDAGNIEMMLSATDVVTGGDQVKTGFGEVVLEYKKKDGKWILEKFFPRNFKISTLSTKDTVAKFAPLSKPICANFSSSLKTK